MATMAEQETTITMNREDEWVLIYTANPYHVRALDKDARVERVDGDGEWGNFRIAADLYKPFKAFKRIMSEEEREARAENLRKVREG